MLVDEHDQWKEKIAYDIRDPNMDVEKVMITVKKQQKAKRRVIKFLQIELVAEAVFQIAGRILTRQSFHSPKTQLSSGKTVFFYSKKWAMLKKHLLH